MSIPVLANHEYPLDQLMDALKTQKPSCLILVTPNNPTGIPIPDEQLFQILDNVPDDLNVAIDRTCANIEPEVSTKFLINKYPHKRLVIFHSFSKYYGMSHLRIGFSVFSNADLAAEVNRYLPFGLNLEALLKATYILSTQGELKPSGGILDNIRANKTLMSDFLNRHPDYSCTDFKSNYAIFFLPKQINSREFYARLQDQGISVMPGHDLPEPDDYSIRLHVGGKQHFMERMIDTIEGWP
jgi:histidinol-phosphate aminotransferase